MMFIVEFQQVVVLEVNISYEAITMQMWVELE